MKRKENKTTILEVTLKLEDGKKVLNWDFPHSVNIYFLLGVLENIKFDLLTMMDNDSAPEIEDYEDEEDF